MAITREGKGREHFREPGAVDEIGFAIGYEAPSFFRRLFKRRTGVAPAQYRRVFKPLQQAASMPARPRSTK